MIGSEPRRMPIGRVAVPALVLTLVFALLSGPAEAAPLPPRPGAAPPAMEPRSRDAPPAIDAPLPLPRPEEDGPPLPPVASDPPLPAPRPEEDGPAMPPMAAPGSGFGPPLPAVPLNAPLPPVQSDTPSAGVAPAAGLPPPEPDLACAGLLAGGKVVARAEPPMLGPDGCGILAPVTIEAVVLRNGAKVPLAPPPLIRCDMAEQLADWVRDDLAPANLDEGDLLGVADAAGYACRSRNWLAGARLSEHARGNAIDIVGFRFAKRSIALKQADAHGFWTTAKTTACARFSTVLGPGSDGFHETNLHLDLDHRRNGSRLCEWDDP